MPMQMGWRWYVFDKITMTTGNIEIKCPKCGYINEIDLSLRKAVSNLGNLKSIQIEQTTE